MQHAVVIPMHGRTQGGVGCRAADPPNPPKLKFKKHRVLDMISKILRDILFSRNQPLKSADDQYIRILKTKLIKLQNQKTGRCDWVTEHVVIFVCT
jgi:hypothetical protein